MAATSDDLSTGLAPAVQAYYDKKFLLLAEKEMPGYQFAQKRSLGSGAGKTVYFTRFKPLAKRTTALTETLTGGLDPDTRLALTTEEISAAVALYGDYIQISKMAKLTALDPAVEGAVDIVSRQAGESMDSLIMAEIGSGLLRRRADADATYQIEGTVTSGTTISVVADCSTIATSGLVGGYITFTAGPNYGITRIITANTNSATSVQTIAVAALPVAVTSASKFRIVVGTGVAATDVMTQANIRLGLRDLKRAHALKAEKGYFIGLINPDLEYDFMSDTTWVAAATYKDSVDSLYNGEIGKWMGIRFVGASQLLRESVAGVASDSGAVHVATILGKEAYGVVELAGQGKKIYVMSPKDLGQAIPMYSTCGWQVGFKALTLNSMYGVNILCGATA